MKRYYVYVIELDQSVSDIKKFRDKNPKFFKGDPCVYVGQSSKKPHIRFEQHKEGYKSNTYAKRFGLNLALIFMKNIIRYQQGKTRKKSKRC